MELPVPSSITVIGFERRLLDVPAPQRDGSNIPQTPLQSVFVVARNVRGYGFVSCSFATP